MLVSPTLSATSRAGQPRPGAPAWAMGWAQLGKARVRTAWVLTATSRTTRAQGSSVPRHHPLLGALPRSEAQSSLTPDAGAGRTALSPPDAGSLFRSFLLLSRRRTRGSGRSCLCCPQDWQSAPAPQRVHPGAGPQRKGFPSASSGFPTRADPGLCPLQQPAAARTTSGQHRLCHPLQLEEEAAARLAPGLERR